MFEELGDLEFKLERKTYEPLTYRLIRRKAYIDVLVFEFIDNSKSWRFYAYKTNDLSRQNGWTDHLPFFFDEINAIQKTMERLTLSEDTLCTSV